MFLNRNCTVREFASTFRPLDSETVPYFEHVFDHFRFAHYNLKNFKRKADKSLKFKGIGSRWEDVAD